jgi:hypothetical protein
MTTKIYITFISIITISFCGCKKKDMEKECKGHFVVYMANLNNRPGAHYSSLYGYSLDNPSGFTKEYISFYAWSGIDNLYGGSAYNYRSNIYYVFKKENKSIYLKQVNFTEGQIQDQDFKYIGSMDSFKTVDGPTNILFCNSRLNKFYYVYYNNWIDKKTDKIFELSTTGNVCTETLIYTAPNDVIVGAPSIDENTGYIYFINGSQLIKVDPTGISPATYTELQSSKPNGLYFNNDDGMFYGVDTGTTPASFIKINPITNGITKITNLDFLDRSYHQFGHSVDECSKEYIIISGGDVRFINMNSGLITREYIDNASFLYNAIYINK